MKQCAAVCMWVVHLLLHSGFITLFQYEKTAPMASTFNFLVNLDDNDSMSLSLV